jgi:DNA polymerase (family 10)
MAEHIREILSTGDYALRKKLLKKYPLQILDLLSLQSLGPKKALLLWREFKCCTVEQLEQLAREGKLRDLAGFGAKTEENILKAVEVFKKISGRFLITVAEHESAKLTEYIARFGKLVGSITPSGSLRRWKETVGDLDLLLTFSPGKHRAEEIERLKEHILAYGELDQVLARGDNKVSFRIAKGLQVDVRLLQPESYGAALIYFTGSKEHNVALRGRALKMDYTLKRNAASLG